MGRKRNEEVTYFIKNWDQADHFVIMETTLLYSGLSPVALVLYANLLHNWREYKWASALVDDDFIQYEPKGCLRSDEELAQVLHTTVSQIVDAKKELIDHDLVVIRADGRLKVRWGDE